MPLQIIRQDITKIKADAIVNPTNQHLLPDGGIDAAIHLAAGPKLLEECKDIGHCAVGDAKVTSAYDLECKHIIHTVGPIWRGGVFREKIQLQSCYKACLNYASNLECESIAIPLISSGSFNYPKDKVLKTAIDIISEFLLESDMMIYLVVYDKTSFELSEKLFKDIEEYIDDSYVSDRGPITYNRRNIRNSTVIKFSRDEDRHPEAVCMPAPQMSFPCYDLSNNYESMSIEKSINNFDINNDITEYLKLEDSFSLMLLKLIDAKGLDDIVCYKRANVSKQTWYKIINDKNYKPNKKTVISFCIALNLTLDETQKLLSSVGFILSKSNLFDVIIMYCITHNIYDVFEIDSILFKYDQETLFSKG